jgi:hypothetical protein
MKNILRTEKDLELFNKEGKRVYWFRKDSDGYSSEYTYDSNGKELTFKDSDGIKRGFDIPEYTMEELVEKLGNFKMVKAKVTFWRTCPVNNQKIDK